MVELLFLNIKNEYLSVKIGPFGRHLVSLYHGFNNKIATSLPLDYMIVTRDEGTAINPVRYLSYLIIFKFKKYLYDI